MGLHDVMLKLGLEYGSEDSLKFIHTLFKHLSDYAVRQSKNLGIIRGIPKLLKDYAHEHRNETILTAQPTGSISLICNQVSSSIEPVFQWAYTRKDSFGEHKIEHFIVKEHEHIPAYAKTALEISPESHVKVQAAIQTYIDASISKTVNLSNTATVEDVSKIYLMAFAHGCKSITVYRSGSRLQEVLSKVTVTPEPSVYEEKVDKIKDKEDNIRTRPRVLFGATFRMNTPDGRIYLTLNEDEKGIREVIINVDKAGTALASHVATEGRLISMGLKYGISIDKILQQLKNQKSTPVWDYATSQSIKSVPDAVAKIIEDYIKNYEGFSEYIEAPLLQIAKVDNSVGELSGELCPECGEILVRESGCMNCKSCGYALCGG